MKSICAVIVTYNRLELLKQGVDSIRKQTYKVNEIIVVNNSSSDGTLEWLQLQNDLTVITQENSGSAGGFYTGIKLAYEKGYEWIWCMDDDVVLYDFCFKEVDDFMNMSESQFLVIQPLKKSSEPGTSNHGAEYIDLDKFTIRNVFDDAITNGFILSNTFCFEGVLINKLVVQNVGLPRKEFFILNDDMEYALRITKYYQKEFIVVLGKILMQKLERQSKSIVKLYAKTKSVSDWDILMIGNYFKNFFLAVLLNYPERYSRFKAVKFIVVHWKWVGKILLSIMLFKSEKMKKLVSLYESMIVKGVNRKIE